MGSNRQQADDDDFPTLSDKDRAEAIGCLYDVALDPMRFETLLDHWESAISPLRAKADFAAPRLLDDPQLASHFHRAGEFLDRIALTDRPDEIETILAPFDRVAALVFDRDHYIRAANEAARVKLGLPDRARLADLPINADDIATVAATLRLLICGGQRDAAVLRVRSRVGGHLIVLRLQRHLTADGTPLVLAASNEAAWPEGFCDILRHAFDLTGAEAAIVRHLVDCRTVAEIAEQRGRSVDTIRAQIKSILSKTETHSQLELVRLALSVMDMTNLTLKSAPGPRVVSGGSGMLKELDFQSLVTPDGRRLDYLVLGDPGGTPVLYLPLDFGLVRWPASAEAEAARRGWRIIVPIRAGYGMSDMVARKTDYDAALVADTMQVLQAENVIRCPVICQSGDFYYAVRLARQHPGVISAIIACSGMLPLTRREQFERMDKWHRFILAGAKYTPHLLPFMVKAGFLLARKIGKRGFFHSVFGNSPGDIATFEEAEVFEAVVTGSDTALSDTHCADEPFSRQLTSGQLDDWSDEVNALRGQFPVIFMSGTQDPQVPPATLQEFRRDYDWIEYHLFEDAGQLAFFRHWRVVLGRLAPLIAE
ncbi:helix-turn-helix transcriptional regulator [Roseovarius sp.]|uniref:helix-turn-helix transcriptional regulator n=1 Tax=Roseovarius sp. TaxID=1486281 RepID=UPI00262B25CE|nr:helix-turn-helix transcriptional regulator [Roseovarius sp.]